MTHRFFSVTKTTSIPFGATLFLCSYCISSHAIAESSYKWSQAFSDGIQKIEVQGLDHKKSVKVDSLEEYLKSLKAKNLTKVIVLGDTGCRIKDSLHKSSYQDCQDSKAWPYKKIAEQIAKEKPELIIHTGDFHYREKCSSSKCQKFSKSIGYGWEAWDDDFFAPSLPALSVAPWIFMRGNHEDCDRAYKVYKDYLASRAWKSECVDYEEVEVIKLGDVILVNMDSSEVSELPDSREDTAKKWKDRFAQIEKRISSLGPAKSIWFLTHKPLYGFAPLAKAYVPTNLNLRKFFEESSFSKKVQLIIGGHIHSAQTAFAKDFPLQLVVGNSGTSLDKFSNPISEANLQMLGYQKAKNIVQDFGYVVLERKTVESPWMISFRGLSGNIQYECRLDSREDCVK